jgi:hypothetical protein
MNLILNIFEDLFVFLGFFLKYGDISISDGKCVALYVLFANILSFVVSLLLHP